MHSQSPQWTEHRFRVVTREALKIGIARPVIINPQAAPRVYILNAVAIPPKSANQFRYTVHGGRKRIDVGNLRAAVISSDVFPTPEKTTFLAARRSTRRTRSSSPPETTSKPQPALPISRNMPRFEFAFTE